MFEGLVTEPKPRYHEFGSRGVLYRLDAGGLSLARPSGQNRQPHSSNELACMSYGQ